jgi:glycosyltransferase involved in cell wall biosynthesis
MKVSVHMVTYNQEHFIVQAVESVLAQKTNFDYELVIGEDRSTDRTREILLDLQSRHPDRIRVLLTDKNLGPGPNAIRTLHECRGEYLAFLEGDDYWTSPDKLQRQVDFLETNPRCRICYHDVLYLSTETGKTWPMPFGSKTPRAGLEDILSGTCAMQTCSVLYRWRPDLELPPWFWHLPLGDLPLHCLVMREKEEVGFLPESMAVYRVHAGGIWSQGRHGADTSDAAVKARIRRATAFIEVYEILDRHYQGRYHQLLQKRIGHRAWELVWLHQTQGHWAEMRRSWHLAFRARPIGGESISFMLKSFLVAHLPGLYSLVKNQSRAGRSVERRA